MQEHLSEVRGTLTVENRKQSAELNLDMTIVTLG